MHLFTLSQKIIGSQKTSIYKNDRKLLICGIIWLGSLKNEEELYMTEEHYNTIYIDFTDEELRKFGWSDERIAWLRYCLGGK